LDFVVPTHDAAQENQMETFPALERIAFDTARAKNPRQEVAEEAGSGQGPVGFVQDEGPAPLDRPEGHQKTAPDKPAQAAADSSAPVPAAGGCNPSHDIGREEEERIGLGIVVAPRQDRRRGPNNDPVDDVDIPARATEKDDVAGARWPPLIREDFEHVAFAEGRIHARSDVTAEKDAFFTRADRSGNEEAAGVLAEALWHRGVFFPNLVFVSLAYLSDVRIFFATLKPCIPYRA